MCEGGLCREQCRRAIVEVALKGFAAASYRVDAGAKTIKARGHVKRLHKDGMARCSGNKGVEKLRRPPRLAHGDKARRLVKRQRAEAYERDHIVVNVVAAVQIELREPTCARLVQPAVITSECLAERDRV